MSLMTNQCLVEFWVRWRPEHFQLACKDTSFRSITSAVSFEKAWWVSINLNYKCFRWKYCQFLQDICGCRREDSHKLFQKNCVDSGWLLEKYWGHQSVLHHLATHHHPACPHWGWVSCHHQPGAWLHQQWRSGPWQCCLLINKKVQPKVGDFKNSLSIH